MLAAIVAFLVTLAAGFLGFLFSPDGNAASVLACAVMGFFIILNIRYGNGSDHGNNNNGDGSDKKQ